MIVDRSAQGELLRINFNISFPALSCEFATLDVSDALGTVSGKLDGKHALHLYEARLEYQIPSKCDVTLGRND